MFTFIAEINCEIFFRRQTLISYIINNPATLCPGHTCLSGSGQSQSVITSDTQFRKRRNEHQHISIPSDQKHDFCLFLAYPPFQPPVHNPSFKSWPVAIAYFLNIILGWDGCGWVLPERSLGLETNQKGGLGHKRKTMALYRPN